MVFKDKQSPQTYDELGQARPIDSKDDRNVAWQQQQKTAQQESKEKEGSAGIPGSNKPSHGMAGPFVDKQDRGVRESNANSPMIMGAYAAGGLGIAYMLLKVLKKK